MSKDLLHEQMRKYFRLVYNELKSNEETKRHIKNADWQLIQEAKRLIDENPDKHFTIPEISMKVGTNEYKLKQLFPIVAGLNIDIYRKYQLCIKVRNMILTSDEPIKYFHGKAGYAGSPSFVTGFRKLFFCTPGELRSEEWDLDSLPSELRLHHKRDNDEYL